MYRLSLVFLLVAMATLVVGFLQDGLTLVLVSIGASIVSAGFLIASVLRGRAPVPAAALAGSPPGGDEEVAPVVALAERATFHLPECRYARGPADTERMTLDAARRRGYAACVVCRPAG